MDQLPRLLLFTCNYVVSVRRGFLFRLDYVILLWHSLSLPYNYFAKVHIMRRTGAVVSVADYGPRGPWFETWPGRRSLWP